MPEMFSQKSYKNDLKCRERDSSYHLIMSFYWFIEDRFQSWLDYL